MGDLGGCRDLCRFVSFWYPVSPTSCLFLVQKWHLSAEIFMLFFFGSKLKVSESCAYLFFLSVFWLIFSYSGPYAFLQMEKLFLLSIKSLLVVYPLYSFSEALIKVTPSGSSRTFSESHWLWGSSPVSGISLHFMLQLFWLWSLINITSLLTSSPHLLVGAGE